MDHEETLEAARHELAESLLSKEAESAPPVGCSKWIAASAMQKAIRRSDITIAQQSAATLLVLDRRMLWRRLLTIAVEDVGIGGPAAISLVAGAAQDHLWRRRHGEEAIVFKLIDVLSESPKCRVADEMYSVIARGREQAERMAELHETPTEELLGIVSDSRAELVERSMAALYAAGSACERNTSVETRRGCDGIWSIYETLGVPRSLLAASRVIFRKTYLPHAAWVPLFWSARHEARTVLDTLDPGPVFDGVPAYAIDCHTRSGLKALRRWRQKVPSLTEFPATAIFDAVAYEEGALLGHCYCWEHSHDIHQRAVYSDLDHAGVEQREHAALLDAVIVNLPTLHEIRRSALDQELTSSSGDLFTAVGQR